MSEAVVLLLVAVGIALLIWLTTKRPQQAALHRSPEVLKKPDPQELQPLPIFREKPTISVEITPVVRHEFSPPSSPPAVVMRYARNALLAKFRGGADLFAYRNFPQLEHHLGEPIESVLQQFIDTGLIRGFNPSEALNHNLRVADLKLILERHGLPSTGRKATLIDRVLPLTNEDEEIANAARAPLYIASESGLQLLDKFDAEESTRYNKAAEAVRTALSHRDLRSALEASGSYHDLLIWGGYRLSSDAWGLASLEQIVNSQLGTENERMDAAFRSLMPDRPPGVKAYQPPGA